MPAILFASLTACLIDFAASSILVIAPFFMPFDFAIVPH